MPVLVLMGCIIVGLVLGIALGVIGLICFGPGSKS